MRAKFLFLLAATFVTADPALAAGPAHPRHEPADPNAPKLLGHFEDWTAATHYESGQLVCYAFTRATNSVPLLPGRGDVVMTVAERPTGRDSVAIAAGFTFPSGSEVTVQVEQSALSFYTAQRSAFAREGAAVVADFERGLQASARSPGPRGTPVVDTFSLRGFGQAHQAIVRACPR
ncbi:MAG TPA: invasion associated locus B family protein [Acidisphaera sp.]|nr:invasion associated locus B family protein [Acidisphaera sp.]